MSKLTWLGHAGFLIESAGSKLVIDAWRQGPTWPGTDLSGIDTVVVSHGHFDHAESAPEICKESGATLVCIHEVTFWAKGQGVPEDKVVGMNKGGTFETHGWRLTMVDAVHSGGCPGDEGQIVPGGSAAGWIIEAPDGERIYHAGDTDVFGDMALIAELWKPDVALLPIGGHFTMGPRGAAKAIELLGVDHVVPMHFGTFPILAGTADDLRALVPASVVVHAPAPGATVDLAGM